MEMSFPPSPIPASISMICLPVFTRNTFTEAFFFPSGRHFFNSSALAFLISSLCISTVESAIAVTETFPTVNSKVSFEADCEKETMSRDKAVKQNNYFNIKVPPFLNK